MGKHRGFLLSRSRHDIFIVGLLLLPLGSGASGSKAPAPTAAPVVVSTSIVTSSNLISDPGFEIGNSGFYVDTSPRDSVLRSTVAPLAGKTRLQISLNKPGGINVWGNDVWWDQQINETSATRLMSRGKSLTVTTLVRALSSSTSSFGICAAAAYADEFVQTCSMASRTVGSTVSRTATLTIDPNRPSSAFILECISKAALRLNMQSIKFH